MLVMLLLGVHRLYHVLRLKNRSISLFGP